MNDLIDRENATNDGMAKLPYATTVLVLGICALASCWLFGVPGIVFALIAARYHSKNTSLYQNEPDRYYQSYKVSNAGFICAIVGLVLSVFAFLILCGLMYASTMAFGID